MKHLDDVEPMECVCVCERERMCKCVHFIWNVWCEMSMMDVVCVMNDEWLRNNILYVSVRWVEYME